MSDNMKILYAIAALALLSTSAQAWQVVERCTYSKFYGQKCTTSYLDDPPRNAAQEQEDEPLESFETREYKSAERSGGGCSTRCASLSQDRMLRGQRRAHAHSLPPANW